MRSVSACAIPAPLFGVASDYCCLPSIEQPPDDAAGNEKNEGKESGGSCILLCKATQVLTVIVQDMRIVFVQKGDQNSGKAYPDMHPYPVLRFAGKAAHKATAQGIRCGDYYQQEGDNTEEAQRVVEWPRKALRAEGVQVPYIDASVQYKTGQQPAPPCF